MGGGVREAAVPVPDAGSAAHHGREARRRHSRGRAAGRGARRVHGREQDAGTARGSARHLAAPVRIEVVPRQPGPRRAQAAGARGGRRASDARVPGSELPDLHLRLAAPARASARRSCSRPCASSTASGTATTRCAWSRTARSSTTSRSRRSSARITSWRSTIARCAASTGCRTSCARRSSDDESGRAYHYFRHDSDWVNAEITVTAAADQVLIAPGYKLDEKVENGRKTAHFKTEAPIHNFFSIQSARYAIGEDQWNDVKLDVYYHPAHRVQRRAHAELDEGVARLLLEELQPVPVPAAAHRRVPVVHELRAGVPGHDPVLGSGRLHHRQPTIRTGSTSSPT